MPLYSDFGLYYAGAGLPSYYGGGGAWGLPRPVMGLRFSPLLPPLAELGRRYSPLPPTRVSSPRPYLPPRPTYVDTADIDVVSPRINPVTGGLREIRRDRTLVRIHTSKVKDSPALQKARRQTPGERLVEKFLIRDKADEAKRKADEQKEKEKMLRDLAASAGADAPVIGGMSEADALDILLTSEEHKLAQDIRRKPTLKSIGSTKGKSKRRDSLPEEPDPGSLTMEVQRKPSLLQRRNTVKKRRNSQDLSLDVQAAVSSRRSSLVSEVDPMEVLMETEESGDKTPVLKFVVDEIRVEESPVSPRKFRYEIIVEDVPDSTNEPCKDEVPSDFLSDKAEVSPKSFQTSKCRLKKNMAVEKVSGDKTPDSSKSKVKSPISGKVVSAPKKTVPSVTDDVRLPVTTAHHAVKNLKPIVEDRKIEAVTVQCDTGVAKSVTNKNTASVPKDTSIFDSKIVGGEDNKRFQVSSKDSHSICVKILKLSSESCLSEPTPVPKEVNENNHKTEQYISNIISVPLSKTKQTTVTEGKVTAGSTSTVPGGETQGLELAKTTVVLEKTEAKKPKALTPIENVVHKTNDLPDPKSSANEQVCNLEKTQAKKCKPLSHINITDEISDQSNKSTNEQLTSSEKTQSKLQKRITQNSQNGPSRTEDQSKILSPPPLQKSQEKKKKLLDSLSENESEKTSEVSAKFQLVVKPRKSDVLEAQCSTQMLGEKTIGKVGALKAKISPTLESNVLVGVKNKEDQQTSNQGKHIESISQITGEKTLGKVGALKAKIPPTTESNVLVDVKIKEDQQTSNQGKHIESISQITGEKTLGKVGALKAKIPPTTESNVLVGVKIIEDQQTSNQGKHIESISQITGENTPGKVGALKAKISPTLESNVLVGVKNKEDQQTSAQNKPIESNSQITGEKTLGKVGALKAKIPPTTESNVLVDVKIKEDQQTSNQGKHIESISQITGEKTLGKVGALKAKIPPTTESNVLVDVKIKEDQQTSNQGKHIESISQITGEKTLGKVGALKAKISPTLESNVLVGVKNIEDQQSSNQEKHIESKNKNDVFPKLPTSQKPSDIVEAVSKSFPKEHNNAISSNSESSAVNHESEKGTAKTELKEEPAEEINFWAFIKGAEEEYVARPIFRTNSEPNRQKRENLLDLPDVESKTGSSYSLDSPTLTDNASLKSGVRGNAALQKVRRDAGKSNALRAKEQSKDSSAISSPNSPISGGPFSKARNGNAAFDQNPTNLLSKPPVQPKVPKVQPHGVKIEGKTLAKSDVVSNVPPTVGTEITVCSETSVKASEKVNKKVNEPLTNADSHISVSNSIHTRSSKQESESKYLLSTSSPSDINNNNSELPKSKDISNVIVNETNKISNNGKEDIVKKLNAKSENQRANLPRSPNGPLKKFNFKISAESSDGITKKPDHKIEILKNYPPKTSNPNSDSSNLLKSPKEISNKSESSKLISNTSEVHSNEVNESDVLKLKQNNVSYSKITGDSAEGNVNRESVTEATATLDLKENNTMSNYETNSIADVKENKDPSENTSADTLNKVADSDEKCKSMVNNIPKKVIRKPKLLIKASKTTDLSHLQEALNIHKDEDKINVSSVVSSFTDDENKCANTAKSNNKFPGLLPRRSKTPPAEKREYMKATTDNGQPLITKMVKDGKEDLKAPVTANSKLSSEKLKQPISPSGTEVLSKPLQKEEPKIPKLVVTVPSSEHIAGMKVHEPPEYNSNTKKMETFSANNASKIEEKDEKTKLLNTKIREANEDTPQDKQTADTQKKTKKIQIEAADSAARNNIKTITPSTPDEIIKKPPESIRNAVEVPDSKGNLAKLALTAEKIHNAQIKNTPLLKKIVPKSSQLPESPKDITKMNSCQDSVSKLNEKEMKNDVNVKPKCADIDGKSPEIPVAKNNEKCSVEPEINTAVNKKLDKTIQLKSEPLLKVKTGNNDVKSKDKLVHTKEIIKKTEDSDLEKKSPISPTKDLVTKNMIITETKEMTEIKTVESSNNNTDTKEQDAIKTSTPAQKEKKIVAGKEKIATETGDAKPKAKRVIVKNKVAAKTEASVDNKKCNKEEKLNKPADKSKLEEKSETSSGDIESHNSENLIDTVKSEKLVSCGEVNETTKSEGENKIVKDDKEPKKDALSKPKVGKAQKAKTKEGNKQVVTGVQTAKGKGKTEQDEGDSQKDSALTLPEKAEETPVVGDLSTNQADSDKDGKESVTDDNDSINAKKTSNGRLFLESVTDSESGSSSQRTSTSSNDSGFDSLPDCDVNCHRKCEKLMPHLCGVNQKLIVEALRSVKRVPSTASDREGASPLASNPALALDDGPKHPALTIPRFRKYGAEDFQFLKVLGKGSFGKVLLAELRGTERYYAVKCLKKDVVLEDNDVECTLIERKVLALGTRHPYLCHLFCTFQTESHLLFVLEYLNGGDLMFHIQQSGRFPEPRARFYAAEIVSGLKFLHKKGIVYRDLKLDNILLDYDGHIRIADFGMCKLQIFLDRMADTFCGTPDYMAPEIIKGLRYNQCVDWWSFGILLYEMLIGVSPFSGCDDNELFWSICNETPQYPRFLSQEAHNILLLLLEKDTTKRLGTPECPAGDVSDQPFFRPIDWFALERRELEPPFKPRVQHPLDVQYFDTTFTTERAQLTPVDKSILETMDQTQFEGFSYTNPYATD